MYKITYVIDENHSFDYEIGSDELISGIAACVAERYHLLRHVEPESRKATLMAIERFISSCNLEDNEDFVSEIEDDLYEYFEADAYEYLDERG